MCYVGRLKGSMYLVNARLVVRNAAKTANTKLDLRNAANSLQIEGNWGCYLGTQPIAARFSQKNALGCAKIYPTSGGEGGVERRRTGPYIYIYNSMVIIILLYVCDIQSSDARVSWRFEMVNGLCQFELAFVLSPVIQGRSAGDQLRTQSQSSWTTSSQVGCNDSITVTAQSTISAMASSVVPGCSRQKNVLLCAVTIYNML